MHIHITVTHLISGTKQCYMVDIFNDRIDSIIDTLYFNDLHSVLYEIEIVAKQYGGVKSVHYTTAVRD